MFGYLSANPPLVVEHNLREYNPVQWLVVFESQQYRSDTILTKGAAGDIGRSNRIARFHLCVRDLSAHQPSLPRLLLWYLLLWQVILHKIYTHRK